MRVVDKNRKRLFVAIDLPFVIRQQLIDLQRHIRNQPYFQARYVNPDQMHITLAFLGNVEQNKIPAIKDSLRNIKIQPFPVCLNHLSYFVHNRKIRIIWIGVQAPELHNLVFQIQNALKGIFVLQDNEEFTQHVTIARIKKISDDEAAVSFLESTKIKKDCFVVDEFILKESIIGSDGPKHRELERYPF